MKLPADGIAAVADHGGSLGRARALFPHAPRAAGSTCPPGSIRTPIRFSTCPPQRCTRLPEPARARELAAVAGARLWRAVAGPRGRRAGHADPAAARHARWCSPAARAILGPTYAEHARAAALAGHAVDEVERFRRARGRRPRRGGQPEQSGRTRRRPRRPAGACRDAAPPRRPARRRRGVHGCRPGRDSLALRRRRAGRHRRAALLRQVLRPGRRPARLCAVARATSPGGSTQQFGPWAVSGPALEFGIRALGDHDWQATMRLRLARDAARLDGLLAGAGDTV